MSENVGGFFPQSKYPLQRHVSPNCDRVRSENRQSQLRKVARTRFHDAPQLRLRAVCEVDEIIAPRTKQQIMTKQQQQQK